MALRLGLFGGTFDPIHEGHVAVAIETRRAFALDHILFVPNNKPPHKRTGPHATYEQRLRMIELACAGHDGLEASRLEEGTERSYTIETLLKVRQEMRTGDRVFFLIGADAFADVGTWHRWREVLLLTEFVVVTRPGHEIIDVPGATVHRLETLEVPYSSSSIRRAIASGAEPEGLPSAVREYVRAEGLYLAAGSPNGSA